MICIYNRPMYVCLCTGVTDRDIADAIDNGAQSLSDLQDQLGTATGCGTCMEFTQELLDNHLAKKLTYAA